MGKDVRIAQTSLSIIGGRLIDPFNGRDEVVDIHVAGGVIVALGARPSGFEAERTISAQGLLVCPGFIDLSARLGEPGFEQKGNIASETAAAAKGGVSHLCYPPDSFPVVDSPAVVRLIVDRATQAGQCLVSPVGALTQGLAGEQLSEMASLKEAGCVAVSNAWQPVKNNQVLRRCMEYAATFDLTLFVNAQDASLAAGACAHEGAVATRLGLAAIPEAAETIAVVTHILLAEQTGIRLHFSQISSRTSAKLIAEAQLRGLAVTADVAIHQLLLSEENIDHYNSLNHCLPPLRSQADRQGLRDAVAQGVVQAICSDHRPHEKAAKNKPFAETEPGISSLETLLPLSLRLVEEGLLDLPAMVRSLTAGPAEVLGLELKGVVDGESANLIVFDPEKSWQVGEDTLISAGKNTPFLGALMKGAVVVTVREGTLVYQA
jgi:dihydroorotase